MNIPTKTTWKKNVGTNAKAIREADVSLFLFDARDGLQPYDEHLAGLLRQSGKPVVLLANKCEGKLQEDSIHEAYKLGLGTPIPFSAEHGLGLLDLYDALKEYDEKKAKKNRKERLLRKIAERRQEKMPHTKTADSTGNRRKAECRKVYSGQCPA